MGLPTSVNFRTSQPNVTAIVGAAPQKADNSQDQARFEQHLEDVRSQGSQQGSDRRDAAHEADRRNRERTSNSQKEADINARKANSDPVTQQNTDVPVEQAEEVPATAEASTAKIQNKASEDTDNATNTDNTPDTKIGAAPKQASKKTDDIQSDVATDPVANTTEKAAGKVAGEGTKTDDQKAAAMANLATASTPTPLEAHKPDIEVGKDDLAATTVPVVPSHVPLVAAAANAAPKSDPQAQSSDDKDPDSKLTITAKEGLGHETAAKMADKTDNKASAAQHTAANTNAQTQTAASSSPGTQNFAKMVAATANSDISSVTATGGSSNSLNALSDLQNIGGTPQSQNGTTATVRVGTLPGQTTPTQIPAMTIALQVARNLQNGVNRFDIRLDPAEMGKIDVRMEVKKDGNVAAHLVVERPETLELLRRDATSLQQALNNAGLQANANSLSFSLHDNNAGNQPQNFAGQAQGGSGPNTLEQSSDGAGLSTLYNINLSTRGGIDIRI